MKKVFLACLTAGLFFCSSSLMSQISYGEGGHMSLRDMGGEQDFPEGPHSFRVVDGNYWFIDSVGAAVKVFKSDGTKIKSISVPEVDPESSFLHDFDLKIDSKSGKVVAIAVIENYHDNVIVFCPDGKLLLKFRPSNMLQLTEIAVAPNGTIYLGDLARSKISVFDESGKFKRDYNWLTSGFAVDKSSNFHYIHWDDSSGYWHRCVSPKGEIIINNKLDIDLPNARVWYASTNNIFVSFIKETNDPTRQKLVIFDNEGNQLSTTSFNNPWLIHRYIAVENDSARLLSANYMENPDGEIAIRNLEF